MCMKLIIETIKNFGQAHDEVRFYVWLSDGVPGMRISMGLGVAMHG